MPVGEKHLACIISYSKTRAANTFLCATVMWYIKGAFCYGYWLGGIVCLVAGNRAASLVPWVDLHSLVWVCVSGQ